MKDDEAKLRLVIDVHYEMGRTDIRELEHLLVDAAEHLMDNGLITGKTEAGVLTWKSEVQHPSNEASPRTDRTDIQKRIIDRLRHRIEGHNLKGRAALRDEGAFLAGAAGALHAVFGTSDDKLTDYVPPAWIICPIAGRSVLWE